ncbi:MAG: hypothetical protein RL514_242 [Verrucomicrobiota bacterium]|jgi:type II secretory pathway pseudopilin PulG
MNFHLRQPSSVSRQPVRGELAFTMVEVALSLAIVAFALVAIIGVMPVGLNVQRDNREDTIMSQEASLLIGAIRAGNASSNLTSVRDSFQAFTNVSIPLSGSNFTTADVVSRLCIPPWDAVNTVAANGPIGAHFRSMSGNLADNVSGTAVGFSYVVFSEVNNYAGDPNNVAHNYYLTNNLYEVKLTFRWPVYEATAGQFPVNYGNGRLVLRTLVSGQLVTNGAGGRVFQNTSFQGL